jgi:transketolase
VRPADANETAAAWQIVLNRKSPVGLCLSRQNLPVLDSQATSDLAKVGKGAYIIQEPGAAPTALILATGSEVAIAIDAATQLDAAGIPTRVVSVPCLEWFEEQSDAYKNEVLPPEITNRVSIEAGIAQGWWKYVGTNGHCVSIEHFGASASAPKLYEEFGITAQAVVNCIKSSN